MAAIRKGRGAGEGNRTPNLLITNQLLCQLSYASGARDGISLRRPAWFGNSNFEFGAVMVRRGRVHPALCYSLTELERAGGGQLPQRLLRSA